MGQMSKRVDFSLGMSGISSGADMGDVYDKPKVRVPVSFREEEKERAEERAEEEGRRSKGDGESLGRTGSRESGSVRSRSRKGVMFGRSREAEAPGDLEAQVGGGGGVQMSELSAGGGGGEGGHLAGIPEVPGGRGERGGREIEERGRVGSRDELIGEKQEGGKRE